MILSERIRSDAPQTLAYFQEQGVEIKVISGDNPATVATIAAKAGVPGAEKAIDARTLPEGDRYLGFLFARADTPAEVEATLRRAHARLDVVIDQD